MLPILARGATGVSRFCTVARWGAHEAHSSDLVGIGLLAGFGSAVRVSLSMTLAMALSLGRLVAVLAVAGIGAALTAAVFAVPLAIATIAVGLAIAVGPVTGVLPLRLQRRLVAVRTAVFRRDADPDRAFDVAQEWCFVA